MASNWFYYNEKGEKTSVTGGQLKWLAKNGKITPGTLIETEDGRTAPAIKIKGLTFGEAAQSEPMTFTFPCPHCQSTLQAKKQSAGKTKECPTCGKAFTVPTAIAPAPPADGEIYGLKSTPESKPSSFLLSEPDDDEVNDTENETSASPPAEKVRPKLYVDVDVNFADILEATAKAKTDSEKRDADAKMKAALLTMGGDINGKVDGNRTRLQLAVMLDDSELITQLVHKGANVNLKDDNGWTPLHYAVAAGKSKSVAALIEHGADVHATETKQQTPLHIVCVADSSAGEIVPLLLKAGANIEAKDKDDGTPLHCAALMNALGTIAALLKAGANVNAQVHGMTAFDIARKKNNPEIADLLRNAGTKGTGEQVLPTAEAGINNPVDNTGTTRLHVAAANKSSETITQLVKKGADVNAKNNDGITALHFAVLARSEECVTALLEAGADVSVAGNNGLTALDCANRIADNLLEKASEEMFEMIETGIAPSDGEYEGEHDEELGVIGAITALLQEAVAKDKAKKMTDMTPQERVAKGARLLQRRREVIEQIKALETQKKNTKELSLSSYCFNRDESMGTMGCGCLILIVAVLLLGWHAMYIIFNGVVLDEFTWGLPLIYLMLIAGGIGWGLTIKNHYEKWKTDTVSNLDSELANATSELAELSKALSWYDNLPKDERDKFDAAVRGERKRQKEEQKAREQERRRQESMCPQCGKEWALSTSWETANTHSEFRTEIKDEHDWNRTGTAIVTHKVPVQIQTLVTTEREITKCSYCNYRREGQSRESRREIR